MTEQRPTTGRLQRLVRAYREAAALMAAVGLWLFTKRARGADTEAALVAALGLEEPNGERIVIACIGLGLIERDGEKLKPAPDGARFLVEGEPAYAGPWMLFTKPDWDEWGRLAAHLRRPGPPVVDNKAVATMTVAEAARYHRATYSIGLGDRKSTRLNSSHQCASRLPSSAIKNKHTTESNPTTP